MHNLLWIVNNSRNVALPFVVGILPDRPGPGGSHTALGMGWGSQDIPHLLALCPGSLCVS